MQKKEVVFQSNSLDVLRKELQNRLFSSPFFCRRYVIVASDKIKQWLFQEFAKDQEGQIAGAIEIISLAECGNFFLGFIQKKFPKWIPIEINFFLEKAIEKVLEEKVSWNDQEKKLFFPLLQGLEAQNPQKRKQKTALLAKQISDLFLEYQLLGKNLEADIEINIKTKAEKNRENAKDTSDSLDKDWQTFLWQELVLTEKWPNFIKNFQEKIDEEKTKNAEIHLFSLSHLPKLFHAFLERLSKELLVCHYQFSPCEVFWEDVVSDREKQALEKFWNKKNVKKTVQQELEDYLSDRNTLLANFGAIGREEQKILEEKEGYVFTHYLPMQEKTLLQKIQKDLLTLHNPQKEVFPLEEYDEDESIQVHQAASAFRELEILREAIFSSLEKDKNLSYRDFQIFACDIQKYAAYIPVVFDEKILPYKILDLEVKYQSSYSQGIFQLFSLLESSWKKEDVFSLFENESFQKKHKLSEEDVDTLREWIEKTNIDWGWDEEQKKNVLQKQDSQELALNSWQWAIERLIADYLFFFPIKEEALPKAFPIHSLGIGDYGLLEKLLQIFSDLQIAKKKIQGEKTLEEWREVFREIVENFLVIIEGEAKEHIAERLFKGFLQKLLDANKKISEKFSFYSLYQQLKNGLSGHFSYKNSLVDSLSFSSMKSFTIYPSKFIGFLGMNEEVFASGEENPFHRFSSEKEQKLYGIFSKARYLFLQAICLAEQQLYISYENISFHEGKEKLPSLLIQEFLSYLESSYITKEGNNMTDRVIKKHAMIPFHPEEFSDPKSSGFSSLNYLAAKSYNKPLEEKKNGGFGHFITFSYQDSQVIQQQDSQVIQQDVQVESDLHAQVLEKAQALEETHALPEREKKETQNDENITIITKGKKEEKEAQEKEEEKIPKTISIQSLRSFAKNPIKFYLQNTLKIYLQEEKKKSLKLAFFDQQAFYDFLWQDSIEKKWAFFEKQGKTPCGIWKDIAQREIVQQQEIQERHVKAFSLTPKEIFSVELGKDVFLDVFVGERKVKIVGELKNISKKGLFVSGEKKLSTMVQIWPDYLCFSSLFSEHEQAMLFYQTGQKKEIKVNQAQEFLAKYLQFFFQSQKRASPLIREWIEPILQQKKEAFEKANQPTIKKFGAKNLYQDWAFSYSLLPAYEDVAKWHPEIHSIFSPILEEKENV